MPAKIVSFGMNEEKWVQKALKPHKAPKSEGGGPRGKGTLTRQAAQHGQTPAQFCAKNKAGKKGIGAKRCALRKSLMGLGG
jgi:hypothetical protein